MPPSVSVTHSWPLLSIWICLIGAAGHSWAEPPERFEPVEFQRTPRMMAMETSSPDALIAPLTTVAYSTDGKHVASGDAVGNVCLRQRDGTQIAPARTAETPAAIRRIEFFAGASWLAALDYDGRVTIWSTESGQPLRTLPIEARVHAIGIDSSRPRLLATTDTAELQLWTWEDDDLESFRHSETLATGIPFAMMSWCAESDSLLLASDNVWEVRRGDALDRRLQAKLPSGELTTIAMSRDGKSFATGFADGKVRWRDSGNGMLKASWNRHPNQVTSLAFSPSGRTLISSCQNDRVRVWNLDQRQRANDRAVGLQTITHMALSPDGDELAVVGTDGLLCLMAARRPTPEFDAIARPETWNHKAAFAVRLTASPDRMWVVAKFGTAQRIDLADLTSLPGKQIDPGSDRLVAAAISPDGTLSAHAYRSGDVRLYECESGRLSSTLAGLGKIAWVEFGPRSGRLAIATSGPPTLHIVDTETGHLALDPIPVSHNYIEMVRWAPDGESVFAIGNVDDETLGRTGIISRWSTETGQSLDEARSGDIIGRLAISPDGSRLSCGGYNGWVTTLNENLEPVSRVECGGLGGLHALRLVDNRRLLVGTYKGSVLLIDPENGRELRRYQPLPPSVGMQVRDIDVLPGGKFFAAVGGWDSQETMRLYRLD